MLRIIARWWAKRRYIWAQETEAATNDLHAGLSLRLAGEKRALIEQLNKDADVIDANIKSVDEKLSAGYWECENGHEEPMSTAFDDIELESSRECFICYKPMKYVSQSSMTGQEKYESDKERGDAQKIAENKRATAKAEVDDAEGSEKAAKYFQGQAANNRTVADKVRKL